MNSREVRIVMATFPDESSARKIARSLVDARLAACVNIVPGVTSVYRWKNEMEEDTECLALLKTTVHNISNLRTRFLELHPYDIPEFVVLNVESGAKAYLRWIGESLEIS